MAPTRAGAPAEQKLAKYRSMRDFAQTAEPSGRERRATAQGLSFVIQAHAARRMHYDFRLELGGVLLSWSVPKGPSLVPGERRLAVRTEDHPISYADFEGIIPQGQYGGGTVVVWDRGSWEPDGDPDEGVRRGRLTFTLHGEKLHGRWHLVRTRLDDGKHESWLLFKGKDEHASEDGEIVDRRPESVITGRTLADVASAADRVWHSNRAGGDEHGNLPAGASGGGGAPMTAKQKLAAYAREKAAAKAAPASSAKAAPKKGTAKKAKATKATTTSARSKTATAAKRTTATKTVADGPPEDLVSLVKSLPVGFGLTSLDKILYREQGISKAALLAYLAVTADWILPHVSDRPLTLVRCPEGAGKQCFFQKHLKPGTPAAVKPVEIPEDDGSTKQYMRVTDMPGLIALAQLGTLELHTWGCHVDKLDRPDVIVFDLDPDPTVGWDRVVEAALSMRGGLLALGLRSWVKTTGGKGLHVVVPVARRLDWDAHEAFAKGFADRMVVAAPDGFTTNMSKAKRPGKIFIDYLRNGRGATFVAPYSPRARPGATVATPVTWDELEAGVDPLAFTIATVPPRLAALKADPWEGIDELQPITAAARKAVGA
jgi:bifunctional non-homologous end joining protein LigD